MSCSWIVSVHKGEMRLQLRANESMCNGDIPAMMESKSSFGRSVRIAIAWGMRVVSVEESE